MANELHANTNYPAAPTSGVGAVYAVLRNGVQIWNTNAAAFDSAYSSSHDTSGYYGIPIVAAVDASGYAVASMPGAAAGMYSYEFRVQAGTTPNISADTLVASGGTIDWTGTAIFFPAASTFAVTNASGVTTLTFSSSVGSYSFPASNVGFGGGGLTAQQELQIRHQCPGTVWCVTIGGNDSNAGTSWSVPFATLGKAVSVAVAGDTIVLGPGKFASSTTAIVPADGVSVIGSGIDVTILPSTFYPTGGASTCALKIPSDARLADFTIGDAAIINGTASPGNDNYCFPLGAGGTQNIFVNALVERVKVVGDTDGLKVAIGTPCTGTFVDCEFNGMLDNTAVNSGSHVLDFIRCRHSSVGTSIATGLTQGHGISVGGSPTLRLFTCSFAGSAMGVDVSTGTVTLFGGNVLGGIAGPPSGSGLLTLLGVDYDRANGNNSNVYDIPLYAAGEGGQPLELAEIGQALIARSDALAEYAASPNLYQWTASATGSSVPTAGSSFLVSSNGHWYACAVVPARSPMTGTTAPATWPTTGGTYIDGNITWQDMGLTSAAALQNAPAGGSSASTGAAAIAGAVEVLLNSAHGAGTWGRPAGNGPIATPIDCQGFRGEPLQNVECWITSDQAGTQLVAGPLVTGPTGQTTFYLAAGTYWLWRRSHKNRHVTFANNPEQITVS